MTGMIGYEGGTKGFLDITFGPKWDYIPLTRNYIENFLQVNYTDKLSINKIAMSASELLENAVKYSSKDGIRTQIRKYEDEHKIELVVYNVIDKIEADKLMKYIAELNSASDPFLFYVAKMKESIKRHDGKSGLGLSRIAHEGSAKLEAAYFSETSDTGIIEVKALFKI
ncbi:MAG: hypothetical protein A2086_03420 [Spirochaetes bacterium GWD1_27_9]|nr:MAG: hypothetical protein A2Z98_14730 [Spirochaetes bacterium GWB1_27_13]OHD24826.1 MAG: hypothetical protein A2Y34_08305 [Spirochaetes bacterium GWC1_27_15]OHD45225.1 MAG: hypothetical protein A2086_03420 [Spirochaetes bacterium GWD1_27_9]